MSGENASAGISFGVGGESDDDMDVDEAEQPDVSQRERQVLGEIARHVGRFGERAQPDAMQEASTHQQRFEVGGSHGTVVQGTSNVVHQVTYNVTTMNISTGHTQATTGCAEQQICSGPQSFPFGLQQNEPLQVGQSTHDASVGPGLASSAGARAEPTIRTCVFIDHQANSKEQEDRVLLVSDLLQTHGVTVLLDLYEKDNPPDSWPMWKDHAYQKADFILLVIGSNITSGDRKFDELLLYSRLRTQPGSVLPLLLWPDADQSTIPYVLQDASHYHIDATDEPSLLASNDFTTLYALLTRQNRCPRPQLGNIQQVPAQVCKDVSEALITPHEHPRDAVQKTVSVPNRKVNIYVEESLARHRDCRSILQKVSADIFKCKMSDVCIDEFPTGNNWLVYCTVMGDAPATMDQEYAEENLFKFIRNLYKHVRPDIDLSQISVMFLAGCAHPGNSFSFCVVMQRKMLQLLLCVPQEYLIAQTGLLQIGYVLGRSGWPLAQHGIATSLQEVVTYRFPSLRKDLFQDVDVSSVKTVNIAVVGPPKCGKTLLIVTLKRYLQEEAERMDLDLSQVNINFQEIPSSEDFGEFEQTEFQHILDGRLPHDYIRPADKKISTLRCLVQSKAQIANRVHAVIFMVDARTHENLSSSRWSFFRAWAKFRGLTIVAAATHRSGVPDEDLDDAVDSINNCLGAPQDYSFLIENPAPGEELPDGTKLTVKDILRTSLYCAELCVLRQRQHELTIARLETSQGMLRADTPLLVATERLRQRFFPRKTIKDLLKFLADHSIYNLQQLKDNSTQVYRQCKLEERRLEVPLQQLCLTYNC